MSFEFTSVMFSKLLLFVMILHVAISLDLYEDESQDGTVSFLENNSKDPVNRIIFNRPDRRLLKLPPNLQTVIPYPRTGRMTIEEYCGLFEESIDCQVLEDLLGKYSSQHDKRTMLHPRLGRKKRSLSEDSKEPEFEWAELNFGDSGLMLSRNQRRAFSKSRNSMLPRVGKKSILEQVENDKRARALYPRIGRAIMMTRLGRNDARFNVYSRATVYPRLGKRGTYKNSNRVKIAQPRLGRSISDSQNEEDE